MRKLFGVALLLFCLTWIGCGSDDDDGGGGGGGGTNLPEVTAVSVTTPPDVGNVNDAAWGQATARKLDIDYRTAPPTATATLTDSVSVQAIVSDGYLFLRLIWSDDSLNLTRGNWSLVDPPPQFLFSRNPETAGEDQVFVMFANGSIWDVWNWRSLTTAPVELAEGMTWNGVTLTSDSGAQKVAYENILLDQTRPPYVHKDLAAFDGMIMYKEDIVPSSTALTSQGWQVGDLVPGFYIDTTRNAWFETHPESRWDIEANYSYSNDTYTLVMKCDLAGSNSIGSEDDIDMTSMDRVKMRVGILNDHAAINIGGSSARGFTGDFYLLMP